MTESAQHELDQKSINILADAVSKAMKENKGDQRFMDLQRIPLICLSMANISKAVESSVQSTDKALHEIKQMIQVNKQESEKQHELFLTKEVFHIEFDRVSKIVYGGVALALVAIASAVFSLILR